MKFRWLWVLMLGLFSLSAVACGNPFKVTDPADPNFKPENFRFEDYPGIPPMTDALKKLFPVGTPREFVEKVLVEAGGATVIPDKDNVGVHYFYKLRFSLAKEGWYITAFYSDTNLVSEILLDGNHIVNKTDNGK